MDLCKLRLTHAQAHTLPTIKVDYFLDIQIKTKRPPEDCITGVVRAYDNFITILWNADQARGTLLFSPKPLPAILSYKSHLAFSHCFFHSVSGALLMFAPFMPDWTRWASDFW